MNNINLNFESSRYLMINLSNQQYTLDSYRDLINNPDFSDKVKRDLAIIKTWQAADRFLKNILFL